MNHDAAVAREALDRLWEETPHRDDLTLEECVALARVAAGLAMNVRQFARLAGLPLDLALDVAEYSRFRGVPRLAGASAPCGDLSEEPPSDSPQGE